MRPPLVLCSKSPWSPAIRREHALAAAAAERGHRVTFLERPTDVRALRDPRAVPGFVAGLRLRPPAQRPLSGVEAVARTTLAPGHRGRCAEAVDGRLLDRVLRAEPAIASATVVCGLPWEWPAVAAAPARRRVFDLADDWSALVPGRARAFREAYLRIAAEADAVIAVSETLAELFPGGEVEVVRNGVDAALIEPAPVPAPAARRIAYVGTLSERFDAELVGAALAALPDWELDLYGACQYARRGDRPAPALVRLLEEGDGRVRWHGPIARSEVAPALDRASVLILPNRREQAAGQDSMKLYDYAARGRPIVTTAWGDGLDRLGPPHLHMADGPAELAAAVRRAAQEPREHATARRRWAEDQRWAARWPAWARAAFGAQAQDEQRIGAAAATVSR